MIDFFVKGGFMMIPMLLVSIAALAFMIERGISLQRKKVLPPEVVSLLDQYLLSGSQQSLHQLSLCCQSVPSALSRLLTCAIDNSNRTKKENQDALETQARREVILLEKWLVFLVIIVGIAPLMGLLGTLHGMITLFGGLGANFGAADPAIIAAGISVTLNVTFMGLAIAVPSLIAWSFYSRRVEVLTMELEGYLSDFVQKIYRQ